MAVGGLRSVWREVEREQLETTDKNTRQLFVSVQLTGLLLCKEPFQASTHCSPNNSKRAVAMRYVVRGFGLCDIILSVCPTGLGWRVEVGQVSWERERGLLHTHKQSCHIC